MIKVFLDSNIYYAAAVSRSGGSSVVLELTKSKRIAIYATKIILREAERNIRLKEPVSTRLRFYDLLKDSKPKFVKINQKLAEKRFSQVINRKDTYVLEGARIAKVKYLVTLDRKHFMSRKMKKETFSFQIITPGKFITSYAEGTLSGLSS